MKGWFDAFRDDGGPTLYSFSNRTPVTGDVSIVAVSVLFATIYLAFLVIFPGVRKQRFTTFSTVTLSLFVGLVIFITRLGSSWHIASTTIVAPYKAFSREKIAARIGTHIGLMHVNVTLSALQIGNWTVPDIDYNERFGWEGATDMKANYHEALKRGLPYPILTVAEYFSLGREGFSWGGQYRAAGYFASILLWTSVASWLLMNLLLVAVPRYGGYMKTLTGFLIVCTNIGYYLLLPKRPLTIYLEGGKLEFRLGWCYWLLLVAGILCFSVGIIISVVDLVWPHTFSTVLEVYYDTPYDRHVILEESRDVRYRKRNSKSLEDPHGGLGSRILRRLSSKNKDSNMAGPSTSLDSRNVAASSTGGISGSVVGGGGGSGSSGISGSNSGGSSGIGRSNNSGIDNKGFQNDVPKSPWRYPFRRAQQILPPSSRNALKRTVSQDSASSIHSASVQISPMHKQALSRVLPKPPLERTRDMVHW